MLRTVSVNVMVRADGFAELVCNHQSGSLRARAACKHHYARTSVRERRLKQAHSNADSVSCASQRTLVIRDGPRISRQLLDDVRQLPLTALDREEEASWAEVLW